MHDQHGVENCLSFIECQLRASTRHNGDLTSGGYRAVTISREVGCGAHLVAERLAALLRELHPRELEQWTIFDRNLVEQVLEDHKLPKDLARFMPEKWVSNIEDTLDELFGLHPPTWILVRQTAETILRLAHLGKVIIIGRGGNLITSRFNTVLHVRLVAPLEQRAARIQKMESLDHKAALAFIHEEDTGRRKYIKKYYQAEVADPLLYHVTLNTAALGCEDTARLLAQVVVESEKQHPELQSA